MEIPRKLLEIMVLKNLKFILNTHHHWDHVGGNKELKSDFPDLKIYGHSYDRGRIPEQTEFLEDGYHLMHHVPPIAKYLSRFVGQLCCRK